ncbi:hypothetical protein BD809_10986 [Aquimarina intermedia]|uniref:Uncharacterized protein n=1 Tax=Aquimarina intermedia TaxID=350814 RepID=A0A5S5BWX1_9FLAO|nr:hypothetical protein BD809_10986 [Aquimarina intermedia]
MTKEEECKECKGWQLIIYSYSRGAEYCKTCKGSGLANSTKV